MASKGKTVKESNSQYQLIPCNVHVYVIEISGNKFCYNVHVCGMHDRISCG